jgi:WD40 repeat protein
MLRWVMVLLLAAGGRAAAADAPVLELETGGHSALVTGVQFTPDGKGLVSVSFDRTIRFWDLRTGQCRRVLRVALGRGGDGRLLSMALSRDGARLAVGGIGYAGQRGYFSPVYVVRTATGELEHVLDAKTGSPVFALAFSPDGKTLAAGNGNDVHLWDASTGRSAGRLAGHTGTVTGLAFSPRGGLLASASEDRTSRVWDVGARKALAVLREHERGVTSVSWSGDGTRLATGSYDQRVCLWSVKGELQKGIVLKGGGVFEVHFAPDGRRLLATRAYADDPAAQQPAWLDPVALKYDVPDVPPRTNRWVQVGAVSPDGKLAATSAGDNHEIHVWGTSDCKEVVRLTARARGRWAAAWQSDAVLAWGERRADPTRGPAPLDRAFSLADLRWQAPAAGAARAVTRAGGLELQLDRKNNTARVGGNGTPVALRLPGYFDLECGTLANGGRWAVLGGDRDVLLFEAGAGRRLRAFTGHDSTVRDLACSPDGKYLLSGGADQACCVWPLQGGGRRLFGGVGIGTLEHPEGVKVGSILNNGAAEADGRLRPGDVILGVAEGDGPFVRLAGLKEKETNAVFRGAEGTVVRLRVDRAAKGPPAQHTLSRKGLGMGREWGGIGAVFKAHKEGLQVTGVVKGWPAAGRLRVGDVVTCAAEGAGGVVRFHGGLPRAAVQSVLGPAGTTVRLRYRRAGEKKERADDFKRRSLNTPLGGLGVVVKPHPAGAEVTELLEGGAAAGALKVGEVITAVGQPPEAMVRLAGLPLANCTNLMVGKAGTPVRVEVRPSERPVVYALKRKAVYEIPQTPPLLRVVNAGDEWVAFTPQGYFASSPGGDELMGWRIDQGPEKLARFFPAEQFRQSLYRPDVIRLLLKEGSLRAALARAEVKGVAVTDVLPPEVRLLRPASGVTLAEAETEVVVEARPRAGRPVTGVRLLVDERAVDPKARVEEETGAGGVVRSRWKVKLPPGKHQLQALAASRVSEGRSPEIVVEQRGKEKKPHLRVLAVTVDDPGPKAPGHKLRFACKDGERLRDYFKKKSPKVFGGEENVHVRELLSNKKATKDAIVDHLKDLAKLAEPTDVTVIYLACHGLSDDSGSLYLLTYGGDPKKFTDCLEDSVLMDRVQDIDGRCILILDTCKSATVARLYNGYARLGGKFKESKRGVALLTACLGDQSALERNDLEPPGGLYTHYLCRALAGVPGARNAWGEVTLGSVSRFVDGETQKSSAKIDRKRRVTSFSIFPPNMSNLVLAR